MFTQIKTLFGDSKEYYASELELAKLKLVDKSSRQISLSAFLIILYILGLLCIGLLSLGIAIRLGERLGEYYYGFFILGGFYFILLLIFNLNRKKWIKKPVSDAIIRNLLK